MNNKYFKKVLIVLMIGCFLLGMAMRAEVEGVKKEIEKEVIGGSDITGEWTQDEIEYFQDKEYVGSQKQYNAHTLDYYPSYLKGEEVAESLKKYGIIGEEDLKKVIEEGKASKIKLLRYYNLLRNEIYARKGYFFKNSDLKEFFGMVNWYQPKSKEITLTGREEKNLKVIEELEEIVKSTKVVSELFTKKIIIKAKWGKGSGEFGLEPLPESYEYRTSFTIDDNGFFYIVDHNNKRINVFTPEGSYLKEIKIPSKFTTIYAGEKVSSVDGIGVDRSGNIYLASSSTDKFLWTSSSGDDILKIDTEGKILDSLTFIGYYVYPVIFFESDNMMYLWGSWETEITAGVPLEFNKKERVIPISINCLRDNSFNRYKKSINLGSKKIRINYDKAPVVFNKSDDSKVAFYDGRSFVFQDSQGEIKGTFSHKYFRYYPIDYGKPYKEHYVIVSAWSYIDENLNVYCIEGNSTYLRLVKCTPTNRVWK